MICLFFWYFSQNSWNLLSTKFKPWVLKIGTMDVRILSSSLSKGI